MKKSNLNQEKLTYFKNKLLSLRHEVVNSERMHEDSATSDAMQGQEPADYENHPADLATEQFEQEREKGFERMREEHLQDIDDALSRIENGTYGISELSGKPIPEERLEAEPTARYLVEEN